MNISSKSQKSYLKIILESRLGNSGGYKKKALLSESFQKMKADGIYRFLLRR